MNKKILTTLIILILLVAGIVGGYFGYKYYLKKYGIEKNVLATVGDKKIYQRDLNERIYGLNFEGTIDNPEGVDIERKKQLLQSLIEWTILDQEAEKNNINVSGEEITDYVEENNTNFESCTTEQQDIIKKGAKYNLLKEKVKSQLAGEKEGNYIVAHFDRYLGEPTDPDDRAEWEKIPVEEREKKYQEEKAYAEKLMNEIHQKIKDDEISFVDGMQIVNESSKVGASSFGTMSVLGSDSFNQEDIEKGTKALFLKEVKEKVLELSAGEMSEPFKVNVDIGIEESQWKEGLIFIVEVTKGNKGTTGYADWLNNKKDEYKVKILNKELAGLENELFKNIAYAGEIGCDANKWGVKTGLATSSGGLIVHTNVRSIDGSTTWPLNDIGIQVEATDKGGSAGSAILRWGSKPTCSSMVENRNLHWNFKTGGHIYMGPMSNDGRCDPGSTDNWCSAAAYLVLGWGNSNHHGIGYSLDCDWNYKVSPMVNGPGTGHWELSSITTGVVNGGNVELTLTWKQDPLPPGPGGTSNLQCVLESPNVPAGSEVPPGTQIVYRVIVRNRGDAPAKNVIVEIPLPDGTDFDWMNDGCTGFGADCGKVIDHGFNSDNIPTFGSKPHAYWWLSEVPKQGDPYWEWGEMLLWVKVKSPPTKMTIEAIAQARKSDNSEIKLSNWIHHNVITPPVINSITPFCDGAASKAEIHWTGKPGTWSFTGFWIYVVPTGVSGVSYSKLFNASSAGSYSTVVPDGFWRWVEDEEEETEFLEWMPPLNYNATYEVNIYGYGDAASGLTSFTSADCTNICTIIITKQVVNADEDLTWTFDISGPGFTGTKQIGTSKGESSGIAEIENRAPGEYTVKETGVSLGTLDDWNTEPASREITLTLNPGDNLFRFKNTKKSAPTPKGWWPFWKEIAP